MVTNSNVSKRDKEEDHKKDESQQSSNEESQEYQYLDDDPTSDCELPNELSEEINGLNANELSIRNTLLEILHQYQSKDVESDKILISLNFINGIIDITNVNVKKIVQSKLSELNEGQQWFDQVLNKKTWTPTSEFINYCNQFTDDMCNHIEFTTLVHNPESTGLRKYQFPELEA
ncbi:2837_t:CDS:2 [Entrophospora sp. SA101]|nr:2837_t:CDS:2 [Entrophospora sp. SA101]CAJ0856999.1 989_t:CDS:2 [Entrophospora sp. SA101]